MLNKSQSLSKDELIELLLSSRDDVDARLSMDCSSLMGLCADQKECASRNENRIFAKVRVSATSKKRILGELDSAGVNRKTLFPETENTIKYLKERYK